MESKSFGAQLRTARMRKNLTQDELHQACDVSSSHISRIERDLADPNLDVVLKLCNTLECDLNVVYRSPRLPGTDHPLMIRIIAAMERPKSNRTYAKLFGAVVALLADWELILRHPRASSSQETWDCFTLLPDLTRCIEEKGYIDWEYSRKFIPWSKGFFRNDAQQRLALVLNRCSFWWLLTERPKEKAYWQTQNFLNWLEALHHPLADDLFHILNNPDRLSNAFNRVNGLAGPYKQYPDVTTVEELVDSEEMPSEVECAAIVYTLIDRALYVDEQYGWAYDIEWAVTAKALFWIGAFRQTMIQCHPNIKMP